MLMPVLLSSPGNTEVNKGHKVLCGSLAALGMPP